MPHRSVYHRVPSPCSSGLLLALLAWPPAGASAATTSCPSSTAYPGDAAAKESIARWMGARAVSAGLPPELPVMAGITESSLTNLDDPRSDYAGYFQMSREIFGSGAYAGFPDRPELQIEWFTETAVAVRERRLATGKPDPIADELTWGEWIADVERPAPQYRSRYQLHLAEARALLGSGCTLSAQPPLPGGTGLSLWGGTQQGLRRKVRVAAICPSDCDVTATGTLRFPETGARLDLEAAAGSGLAGAKVKLALVVPPPALKAARKALRRGERVRARIDVTATDGAGGAETARRNVQLG